MIKEQRVILLGVVCMRTDSEEEELNGLISEELDWAYIVGELVRHRIDGNFYCGLNSGQRAYIFPKIKAALRLLSDCYRAINTENLTFLQGLLEELDAEGIRAAGLKGVVFNTDIYDLGARKSNDIDLMVAEKDLKRLDAVMRRRGFIQSLDGGKTEASKKEKLIQIMNYHDLIPYFLRIDRPYMDAVKVDINFHFDEKDHDITEAIFDYGLQRYEGNGFAVRGLNKYTHLIQLCVHYFRETTNALWVNKVRDLDLYKIVDIENTIRKFTDEELVNWTGTVKRFELEKKCYLTLHYLNLFYNNERYEKIMRLIEPSDISYINRITGQGGKNIAVREKDFYEDTFNMKYGRCFSKTNKTEGK